MNFEKYIKQHQCKSERILFNCGGIGYIHCDNSKDNFLLISLLHYENTSVQYTAIFHGCKNDNFHMKNCIFFSYFCS